MSAEIPEADWLGEETEATSAEASSNGSGAVKTARNDGDSFLEANLLQQIALGDQQAFSQLYDRFAGTLFAVAFRILNNPRLAEDIVQDAFVQIWDKAGHFNPQYGKPLSWAVTLTRNKAIDHLRSLQRQSRLLEQVKEQADGEPELNGSMGGESLEAAERAGKIRLLMNDLPTEQKQAIEMAFFGGLTQTEIAEILQQPLGTIKARIRRGMLKLREALDGQL